MKCLKKIISFLLALVMIMGMSTIASADEGTGSIIIKDAVDGKTYTLYRIFDLESYNKTSNAYAYIINDKWGDFANTDDAKAYVKVDDNGYVSWVNDASATEFAAKAIAYATAENTKIASDYKKTAGIGELTFENLPLGYYLVESSLGTLCVLTTTNPNADIYEKNAGHTLDKEVQEGNNWGNKNDANVGDTVNFRSTITISGIVKNLIMHDTMDERLSFNGEDSVRIYVNDSEEPLTDGYQVVISGEETGSNDTFQVKFTEQFCETLNTGDVIVVYYSAILTEKAVVKEAQINEAHLEYKDNSNNTHTTEPDKTETYTWELPVFKYTNGDQKTPLDGAGFTLYKTYNTETREYSDAINLVKIEGEENVYQVCTKTGCTDTHLNEVITGNTGKFIIEGLDSGIYYLKETTTPNGYNKLDTVVTVEINSNGKINATEEKSEGASQIEVENKTGPELPSTGGMGTTIFYILGGSLAVIAAILLITKKRMSVEK